MSKVINITPNGIGRLDFNNTPDDVQALCTSGFSTCVGIAIIGNNGISLIHDSSRLPVEDISKEFEFVGNLNSWHLLCLENTPKAVSNRVTVQRKIIQHCGLKKEQQPTYSDITNGIIIVNRNGELTASLNYNDFETDSPSAALRREINDVNDIISSEEIKLPADLQYNGSCFTDSPSLLLSPSEILSLAKKNSYQPQIISMLKQKLLNIKTLAPSKDTDISQEQNSSFLGSGFNFRFNTGPEKIGKEKELQRITSCLRLTWGHHPIDKYFFCKDIDEATADNLYNHFKTEIKKVKIQKQRFNGFLISMPKTMSIEQLKAVSNYEVEVGSIFSTSA